MIDHMIRGETELALSDISFALYSTAMKYYGAELPSDACTKRFLQENLWMIIAIGTGGTLPENSKLPFSADGVKADEEGCCTFEQIIGYLVQCGRIE